MNAKVMILIIFSTMLLSGNATAKNPKEPKIGLVNVVNTPQVEHSPKEPVRTPGGRENFDPGVVNASKDLFTVPSGKRLIVQYFSGDVTANPPFDPDASARCSASVRDQSHVRNIVHRLQPVENEIDDFNYFVFSAPIILYAEADEIVAISCAVNSLNGGSVYGELTGYLVDVE